MLFEEIDEQKTKNNVDKLLSSYHRVKRLAGADIDQKVTSTYSFEPRSFTGQASNPVAKAVERKIDASILLRDIQKALNCLPLKSRQRIYLKYLSPDRQYDYEIYNNQNISESTYYRELGQAQIDFSESFRHGELIVYTKNGR